MHQTKRKTKFVTRAAAALAFLAAAAALAQAKTDFKLVVGPVGNEIRLRWGGSKPYPAGGFTVERKDGGDWKQIAGPLKIETDPAKLQQILGPNLDIVLKHMKVKNVQELGPAFQKNTFWAQVIGMAYPEVAVALGTWFVDKDVQPGTTYSYRIRGDGKVFATEEGIAIGKEMSVEPPVDLMAGETEKGVLIEWPKVSFAGVAGTAVYRAEQEAGPYTRINPVLVAQPLNLRFKGQKEKKGELFANYLDATTEVGKTYYYCVASVNLLGQESPPSKTVAITLKDIIPPDMPQNVKTELQERKRVVVTWDPSPSQDVAGYLIYRGPILEKLDNRLTPQSLGADVRSFTDDAPPQGAFSWYVVIAVDRSGNE